MARERTAVVVGGGIGGLAAAAGLTQRGWTVTVLEQAPEFAEIGAAISLWPNALAALDLVGAGVALGDERITTAGGLRSWTGRWIVRLDDLPEAAGHLGSAVVAYRPDLLGALLDQVPPTARRAGARVVAAHDGGDRATVTLAGGETLTADVIVGADGLRSAVRAAAWPGAPAPRYAGQTAWRVVQPRPGVLDSAGPEAWAETWGPGGVFGTWPVPGGRVYCYGTATVPAGGRHADPADELEELRARFADWCEPIPAVLAAASPAQVLRNDVYHLPPLRTYRSGRVVLLGDAAHAMTPNLGQGGCQALEDAATLAVLLADRPGLDIDAALDRYDAVRRPRTQRLARRSRSAGTLSHLRAAPARAVRDHALRVLPRERFARSLAANFDWHIDEPRAAGPAAAVR